MSSALIHCSDADVPVIICNSKSQPQVFCHDLFDYHKLTFQLKNQISWIDLDISLLIYQQLIKMKIFNQLQVLKFQNDSSENHDKILNYYEKINFESTFDDLDTIESISARIYFKSLFGKEFKRSNDDYINASLNYGYAIIRSLIMNVIISKGLHPSIGLWHHSQFNNFNLADDLIEIYRPMVDYLVSNLDENKRDFDKDTKKKIQLLLLQNVEFDNHIYIIKQTIIYFVDSLIQALNNEEINDLILPKVRIDLYEY